MIQPKHIPDIFLFKPIIFFGIALALVLSSCQAAPTAKPTATNPASIATLAPTKPAPTTTQTLTPTSVPQPTLAPTAILAPPNKPEVTPGPDINVNPGEKIAIRAHSEGATDYKWELVGDGQISGSGEAVLYTAPDKAGGVAILTVAAINQQGSSAPTSVTITIGAATQSIRLDALAIPAGFMIGEGSPENYISFGPSPVGCHTATECQQISYRSGAGWGGVYWWPVGCGKSGTPDAWNRVKNGTCGINILKAGNLSAVTKLTFWAMGKTGKEVIEFKVGAVDILPSPGRSTGKVSLPTTWNQYEIDMQGVDLTNVIALFGWIAADTDNPQGAVFYLDDIQFEGVK
jgi:hypothetical protein